MNAARRGLKDEELAATEFLSVDEVIYEATFEVK